MYTKSILSLTAVAAALALFVAPLAVSEVSAFSSFSQLIKQSQSISQNSQCVSGSTTTGSCNNVATNTQTNTGNQVGGTQ